MSLKMEETQKQRILKYFIIVILYGTVVSGCRRRRASNQNDARIAELTRTYEKRIAQLVEQYDKQHVATLTQMCGYVCASQWTQWTDCSKKCGGGTRNRTRSHQAPGQCSSLKNYTCPHKELHQQENCNQACPNGGEPSDTGCLCTPAWTGNCCRQPVRCPYMRRPDRAYMDGRWPAIYETIVTFTCTDGYHLSGSETMQCSADGTWNPPTVPTCSRITCSKPKVNPNIKIWNPQEQYEYDNDVYFACPLGYVLLGPISIKCIRDTGDQGKWNSPSPSCESRNCGDPGSPAHGVMNGTSFNYGGEVSFSCEQGYQLLGHEILRCMASGTWYGTVPQCIEIKCDAPEAPRYGSVQLGKGTGFDSLVLFSCHDGYVLHGSPAAICNDDGNWNASVPDCRAATCVEPTVPKYGSKDGSQYFYPHSVEFSCYSGYTLQGAKTLSCKADGNWTGDFPTCAPCRRGFYMDKINQPGVCQPCPANTNTSIEGSTSMRLCVCNNGYQGPHGGPCTAITCPELYAPENGTITKCSRTFGGKCQFDCNDGYVIDKGSQVRSCRGQGRWDGTSPHCASCPKNYFKENSRSCVRCPSNSLTEKEASMKTDCKCIKGYKGPRGGPCEDDNECERNNGRGPCEDACHNKIGGFTCECSRPGYEVADDGKSCKVERECRNLTQDDAPGHGGLVCHWYYEENSQQCSVMCNDGYMFPTRINNYETCGPTTKFTWSYKRRDPNARIPSCIEEFFPGMRIESDANFFTTNCANISDDEKNEIFKNFKQRLDDNKVCILRNSTTCNITDMGIICGRRVKRNVPGQPTQLGDQFDMRFSIQSVKKWDDPRKDCKQICPFLRIRRRDCSPSVCNSAYKRYLKLALRYAKRQLKDLFENRRKKQRLMFSAAGRYFYPGSRIRQGDVLVDCPIGMVADPAQEFCVPCEPGTFYNSSSLCEVCPEGTFQPFKNQTTCISCLPGTTTNKKGSLMCDICPLGTFGEQCGEMCTCMNGTCNPIDGTCTCYPGWEGPNCDQDVDGCREVRCYPGVACVDVPAPATGFNCEPCPPGFVGDGLYCERDEL